MKKILLLLILLIPLKVFAGFGGGISYSVSRDNLETETDLATLKSQVDTNVFDVQGTQTDVLLRPQYGSYSVGAGYVTIGHELNSFPGESKNYTYNAALSLFPQKNFPLILNFNRNITQLETINRFSGTQSSLELQKENVPNIFFTETNNYGGLFRLLSSTKFPTAVLSINKGDTHTDDTFHPREEERQSVRAELTKGGTKIRYRLSYNHENFIEKNRGNKFESDIYSMNFEDQLNRRTIMRLFSNLNERENSNSINAGGNVFVRHTNTFDTNYEYTMNRDDDKITDAVTYVNSLHTNARYSPNPQIDSTLNYGYSQSSGQIFSNIHSLSTGANYRWKKNLIPNGSISMVKTKSDMFGSFYHNYQAGINHSHQFRLTMLNTGYNSSLGIQSLDPGFTTRTLTNSLSTNLSSTAVKYAQLFSSYRFSHIISDAQDVSAVTVENSIGAGANSNYLRDTTLRTTVNYSITNTDGEGVSQVGTNHNFYYEAGGDYSLNSITQNVLNMLVSGGFIYSLYISPGGDHSENKTFYYQANLNEQIMRSMNVNFVFRQQINQFRTNRTIDTIFEAHLDYTLGRMIFQTDYHFGINDTADTKVKEHRIVAKISRYF